MPTAIYMTPLMYYQDRYQPNSLVRFIFKKHIHCGQQYFSSSALVDHTIKHILYSQKKTHFSAVSQYCHRKLLNSNDCLFAVEVHSKYFILMYPKKSQTAISGDLDKAPR